MILSEKQVKKTRKKRRCDWCGEHIEQNDPSIIINATWDGDFSSVRFHPECHKGWDNSDTEIDDEWELHAQARGKTIDGDPVNKGTK